MTLGYLLLSLVLRSIFAESANIPKSFVDLSTLNPHIPIELRYASSWNFMGRPVPGYERNRCYLTKEAADALLKAQSAFLKKGLSLLLFDCYRPDRSVQAFVKWSKDSSDTLMKPLFYPTEEKSKLIENGYISNRSGHSRGSTVDLTLIRSTPDRPSRPNGSKLVFQEKAVDCRVPNHIEETGQLNMGTHYDCFSSLANTENPRISNSSKRNRNLLKDTLTRFGFENYSKEWWHYTLKNEPFPDQYFDF